MGHIVRLEEYRRRASKGVPGPGGRPHVPEVTDSEILSRDYSQLDSILFAIVRSREILEAHLPYREEWKHFLLTLVGAAYARANGAEKRLTDSTLSLKRYVLTESTTENRVDMNIVWLFMDLIEKSQKRGTQFAH